MAVTQAFFTLSGGLNTVEPVGTKSEIGFDRGLGRIGVVVKRPAPDYESDVEGVIANVKDPDICTLPAIGVVPVTMIEKAAGGDRYRADLTPRLLACCGLCLARGNCAIPTGSGDMIIPRAS